VSLQHDEKLKTYVDRIIGKFSMVFWWAPENPLSIFFVLKLIRRNPRWAQLNLRAASEASTSAFSAYTERDRNFSTIVRLTGGNAHLADT